MRVRLASASPRRRHLLTWSGVEVEVCPQHIDETWDPSTAPVDHARALAIGKARSALGAGQVPPILAADTVVHLGGRIYDKPRDRDEARAHLEALAGRTHHVTTGVCLVHPDGTLHPFHVTTAVRLRALTPAEIDAYVATGEADDKAGAYGIQGRAGAFVAEVHGSWTNVMGLPVEATLDALRALQEIP